MDRTMKTVLVLVFSMTLVPALRRSSQKGRAVGGEAKESTLAARVLNRVTARMESKGVDTSLAKKAAAEVVEELSSLASSFNREQTSEEQGFCQAQEDFSLADLESEIRKTYTQAPWKCMETHRRRRLFNRGDLTGPVFKLFNDTARTTSARSSKTANLVTRCMFQDFTEKFGESGGPWSSDGFDEWSKANLDKFPGVQRLITEQIVQTVSLSNSPMKDASEDTWWILQSATIALSGVYRQAQTDAERFFVFQKLKKMYMVMFGQFMFADVDAGKEDMSEALFMIRVWFYENVYWAVTVEKRGVSQGAPGADAENVALGEKLLTLYKKCFFFKFFKQPPQIRFETRGQLIDRGVLLYTMWNHRYVQFFKNTDDTKAACVRRGASVTPHFDSKWKLAPGAMVHEIVALATPLNRNDPAFSEWFTYRAFGLSFAGFTAQQDCFGKFQWLPRLG